MNRTVRRLLLLALALAGAWTVRRVLAERAERADRRKAWMTTELAASSGPHPLPVAPVLTDADSLRPPRREVVTEEAPAPASEPPAPAPEPPAAEAATTETPAPEAPAPEAPGAPLDQVRQRLAALNVDEPPARPAGASRSSGHSRKARRPATWIGPMEDGSCRESYPVKVKLRSGLFHLPGMLMYERTRADRCYRSAEDAVADGFDQAKR